MQSSKYKLVVFVRDKGRLKNIEIIPSQWTYYDNSLNKLFAYYPENKSNNKDTWRKIEESIKECKSPQKSWPVYEVDIRDIADCYEEAERKLSNLARQSYVFSTDCEVSARKRSLREKNKYKFLTIKNNPRETKDLFDSTRLNLKKENKPSGKSFSNDETDTISYNICEKMSKVNSIDSIDSSFSETRSKLEKKSVVTKTKKRVQRKDSCKNSRTNVMNESGSTIVEENSSLEGDTSIITISPKNITEKKQSQEFKRVRKLSSSSSESLPKKKKFQNIHRFHSEADNTLDSVIPHSLKSYNKDANLLDDQTLAKKQRSTESLKNYTGGEFEKIRSISFDGDRLDKKDNKMNNDGTVMQLIKECYQYCRGIDRKIDRMRDQLIDIKNEITQLKATLMTNQGEHLINLNFGHDEEADGFKLPCSTIGTLNAFDTKLKEDKAYRRKIYVMIKILISKDRSIPRNLGETIRQFITKNVANQMTPLRQVPGKVVFAELKLYACLYAIYSQIFGNDKQPLPKKTFEAAIKGVINNSMDWSGGRSRRYKQTENTKND